MAEPPGAGASLGIESVHWHATGHSSVTVVVTGWWTRRPRWHGRPVLVIEENGRRHRLPAIPEPPSRTGTSPRTWRMTFSLPAWLVEYLNQSAWLQLGSVIVALPEVIEPEAAVVAWGEGSAELQADAVASAEPSPGDELPEPETGIAPAADAEPLEQPEPAPYHEADTHRGAMRWLRRRGPRPPAEPEPVIAEPEPEPELELVPAPEPEATEPEPEAETEAEVAIVREPEPESEPEGSREPPVEQVLAAAAADLGQRIRRLERERRTAEQRAHAEEARRIELEDQQVELTRKANRWRTSAIELAAAEHRIRELETELGEVTRRLEDAEHAAGTAEAERDRTLRDLDYIRRSPWRGRLPDELVVARRPRPARTTGDSEPVAGNGHSAERARAQLRREQEAVATSESNRWRDRALGLERQLRDHAHRAERLYEVIDDLRAVLDLIRGVPSEAPESQRPLVEPLRLDAALERLRETIPPQSEHEPNPGFVRALESARGAETTTTVVAQGEPTAAEPAQAHPEPEPLPERQLPAALPPARARWLLRVLRKLAKEDPVAAGRLVVQLLPAQRIVYNEPVAYDIALADARDVQLTCRDGETRIAYDQRHREAAEINFRLTGELEALGRLVAARPFRRRFGRRMPELEGDRKAVAALRALVRAPVGLLALSDAGVRLDPWLTFTLLSLMIRPAWTKGERFTVAHSDPEESLSLCLRIADGARPSVEPTPASDEVDTTIVCERYGLLPVIVGQDSPGASILGDQEPLAKLRQWSHRAERD